MWEVFEALLKARGITAADFSRATGISQATLSTWKKRGTPIGSRHAQTIADYFAVPVDFLMTGKAETPTLSNPDARELYLLIERADKDQIQMTVDFLKRIMAYKEGLDVLTKDKNREV